MEDPTASDDQSVSHTVVFFCGRCRCVLGDSLSLAFTNPDMRIIALSGGSNIIRKEVLNTSRDVADSGCTFFPLFCAECESQLGKYYVTTTRALDDLRDRYTLQVDKVSSYVLGSVTIGSALEKSKEEVPEKSSEIEKMQTVLVDLAIRMAEAEKQLQALHNQNHLLGMSSNGNGGEPIANRKRSLENRSDGSLHSPQARAQSRGLAVQYDEDAEFYSRPAF